jgi:hypothetical protein
MIQEHAKEVAKKPGISDFEVSDWCLESFRKWNHFMLNDVYGESGDINEETSKLGCQISFNYGLIQAKGNCKW